MTRKSRARKCKAIVPIDPNDIQRMAARGKRVIEAYRKIVHVDAENALGDMLSDLMHLCDSTTSWGTFKAGLKSARMHYEDEILSR